MENDFNWSDVEAWSVRSMSGDLSRSQRPLFRAEDVQGPSFVSSQLIKFLHENVHTCETGVETRTWRIIKPSFDFAADGCRHVPCSANEDTFLIGALNMNSAPDIVRHHGHGFVKFS